MRTTLTVLAVSLCLVAGGVALAPRAARADDGAWHAKNLKILPKNISKAHIKKIMKRIAASLGVKCEHCHVKDHFDADTKRPKLAARHMMKLVHTINTKFLNFPKAKKVSCWTCHRGEKEPAEPPKNLGD